MNRYSWGGYEYLVLDEAEGGGIILDEVKRVWASELGV